MFGPKVIKIISDKNYKGFFIFSTHKYEFMSTTYLTSAKLDLLVAILKSWDFTNASIIYKYLMREIEKLLYIRFQDTKSHRNSEFDYNYSLLYSL